MVQPASVIFNFCVDCLSSPRDAEDTPPTLRPWPCPRKHAAAALCTATLLNEAEEADFIAKIEKANSVAAEAFKKTLAAHAKAAPGTEAPKPPVPAVIPLPSLPQAAAPTAGAASKRYCYRRVPTFFTL